jgi:DNA-binding CsgD family transcriptional regulator
MICDKIHLTPREADVFLGMALGESLRESSSRLGISVSRVKNLRTTVFQKLNVNSSGEAVREGIRHGILRVEHFSLH